MVDSMKVVCGFLNLTPHDVSIYRTRDDGQTEIITIPKSGMIACLGTREIFPTIVAGITIVTSVLEGLEFPQTMDLLFDPGDGQDPFIPGLIVSRMVLDASSWDTPYYGMGKYCFCPDTGPTAIRNDKGQIIAVKRLIRARSFAK